MWARRPKSKISDLSELSKNLLGKNGVERFSNFKELRYGWDGAKGKPLAQQSVASFEFFVHRFYTRLPLEPSVFLSSDGNLLLGWENERGKYIEVEFCPTKIQFFNESFRDENIIAIEQLDEIEWNFITGMFD